MKEISKRGRVVGTLSRSPTIRKAGCHPRDWVSHILAFSLWVFIAFVHLHVSYTSKDWVSHILAFSLFGFSSSVFAHVVLNALKYLVPYILTFSSNAFAHVVSYRPKDWVSDILAFSLCAFAFILNSLAFDVRFPIRGDTPNRNDTAKQGFEANGKQ